MQRGGPAVVQIAGIGLRFIHTASKRPVCMLIWGGLAMRR